MPDFETLILERKEGLARLTINRPKSANTLNRKLMQEFNEVLDFLETDRDTRVVLLTGAGERHFCGGADLREATPETAKNTPAFGRDPLTHFDDCPTGLAQTWETVLQLRGEAGARQVPNAKLGAIQMIGAGAVCFMTILER